LILKLYLNLSQKNTMYILKPYIFQKFPEIIFGLSTKIGGNGKSQYGFNLSYSVGDEKSIVDFNRKIFFESIGLDVNKIAFQRQIHSAIVKITNAGGDNGESDALITNNKNLGLAVTIADCTPIFIYDWKNKVLAAVHSGWRGTAEKILTKTLLLLRDNFGSDPENLFVYIGPSISVLNYEVGKEVAKKFEDKYVISKNEKLFLDISGNNYDMILEFGVPKNQIQKSEMCTFEFRSIMHSYRRDGAKSGRSLGVIGIKG
jgi:YfiH family protein